MTVIGGRPWWAYVPPSVMASAPLMGDVLRRLAQQLR